MLIHLAFTKGVFDKLDVFIDGRFSASLVDVINMFGSAELICNFKLRIIGRWLESFIDGYAL